MNYYRRFMGDYASKTADLSLAEHGAYTVLLDISYSTESGLPSGYDALYRLCRAMTKAEQDAVRLVADRFFPVCEDGLRRNARAADEIAKAQETINKQRKSGVESSAKRWSTDGSTDRSTHESTDAAAIQPPTTNLQPPASNRQPPASNPLTKPKVKPVTVADAPGRTNAVWRAYSVEYKTRYQAEPTRNAKVNGMLGKFLERVPVDEAPDIAGFYVQHNGRFYVQSMHKIDHLLSDAEKLRTEWQTGRRMTSIEAKGAEAGDAVAMQAERVGKLLGVQP